MEDEALQSGLDVVDNTAYRNRGGKWITFRRPVLLENLHHEPGIVVVALDDGHDYEQVAAVCSRNVKHAVESGWPHETFPPHVPGKRLVAFVLPLDTDEYLTQSSTLLADIKSKYPSLAIHRHGDE